MLERMYDITMLDVIIITEDARNFLSMPNLARAIIRRKTIGRLVITIER